MLCTYFHHQFWQYPFSDHLSQEFDKWARTRKLKLTLTTFYFNLANILEDGKQLVFRMNFAGIDLKLDRKSMIKLPTHLNIKIFLQPKFDHNPIVKNFAHSESIFFTEFEARFEQFERFFRQLRSKSCFKMSGLSCFWAFFSLKKTQIMHGFWAFF